MIETFVHVISATLIFTASIVPGYLTFRLKKSHTRKLTLLLTIFVVIHGIYHLVHAMNFDFLADDLFEPASVVAMIIFGSWYVAIIRKRELEKGIKPRDAK